MEIEKLKLLEEDVRLMLEMSDRLNNNSTSFNYLRLRATVNKMVKTVETDLLILFNLIYELQEIDVDADIALILDECQDLEN